MAKTESEKRILFCTNVPKVKELGASKVIVELSEEMSRIGWHCELVCPSDFPDSLVLDRHAATDTFHRCLRQYLHEHAHRFDVIDYDHEHLPYHRSEFTSHALFVARSVLLVHHLLAIPIPTGSTIRARIGALTKGAARRREWQARVCRAQGIVEEADLVNVSNDEDRNELVQRGVPADKIVVIPYGISRSRRPLFDSVSSDIPTNPVVAFVGTFDYRKGAREFPKILSRIAQSIPNSRFSLLGVCGLFKSEKDVMDRFPKSLAGRIDIRGYFKAQELPALLSGCSVGVFPSYIEGMPFGVLEMLAASVPVVAYDSPGAPMILSPDYLVPRGDATQMADKIIGLLRSEQLLGDARKWAKQRSQEFTWEKSARMTDTIYTNFLRARA